MSRNMLDMSHMGYDIKSIINFTYTLKKCCVRYSLNVYYYKSLIHIVYLTTRCRRSCVKRQFIMSKRKFQDELDAALAPVLPYLIPEKPRKRENPQGPPFCRTWSQKII